MALCMSGGAEGTDADAPGRKFGLPEGYQNIGDCLLDLGGIGMAHTGGRGM